jgi:hypothetical protein
MYRPKLAACAVAAACAFPAWASANDSEEMEKIRAEIQQMKQNYEARIQSLENRLEQAQAGVGKAEASAAKAETAAIQATSQNTASASAFNPGISLILSGTYSNLSQNPKDYTITGYQAGGDIGPGERSFSLGESELDIYGNIDHYFYGAMNLALASDNTVSVEEAFIQTAALPAGITLKAGRYFSGIGYLNSQHAHAWDFVDSPLVYQAFLGGQYGDDGVQIKWVAPTDLFIELGTEAGRGRIADTDGKGKNGTAAGSLFAHIGGDVGLSHSWRAGLSYLHISPNDRESNSLNNDGDYITNTFNGTDKMWIADFVWKWAPNGNPHYTSLKLQGEYMHRDESGTLLYEGSLPGSYHAEQSGWYAQGVYQFMPEWRTALRFDRLDGGSINYGSNNPYLLTSSYNPNRISFMVDYNPSEFSRIRLQLERDKSQENATDNQIFIQYIMSLGSHGAHQF